MKKEYITYIILFIFSIVIGINDVDAIRAKPIIGSGINTGIQWYELGSTERGKNGNYIDNLKKVEVNGKQFTAYCLDPGLTLSKNDVYECTPTSDPGIIQIVSQATPDNYSLIQLALRFYSARKGLGSSKMVGMKAAVTRFLQIKAGFGSVMEAACHEKDGADQDCSTDAYKYLVGEPTFIDAAFNMANNAYSPNGNTNTGVGGLNFVLDNNNSTPTNMIYKVTSFQKFDEIKFVCDGCIINEPSTFKNVDGPITLSVTPTTEDCEQFKIKAYYIPKGVHLCTLANPGSAEDHQFLIADFDEDAYAGTTGGASSEISTAGDAIYEYPGTPLGCGSKCCELEDPKIIPGTMKGEVKNCCYDATHSWASEYDLNELFCDSEELDVNEYWAKCDADSYKDMKMENELDSKYCEVYCTERVSVDIPYAITATSGRYFKLTSVEGKVPPNPPFDALPEGATEAVVKSPYVEGFKRCRTIIHFKKWQEDFRKQVEKEIEEYKRFQKYKLTEYAYLDATKDTASCNLTIDVTCSAQSATNNNCSQKNADGTTTTYSYTNSWSGYSQNISSKYTKDYTQYRFRTDGSAHNKKYYYWPKLKKEGFKDDANGYYYFYELEPFILEKN